MSFWIHVLSRFSHSIVAANLEVEEKASEESKAKEVELAMQRAQKLTARSRQAREPEVVGVIGPPRG